MDIMEAMCLNKKIRKGMNHPTKDISIFDNQGLNSMLEEMKEAVGYAHKINKKV